MLDFIADYACNQDPLVFLLCMRIYESILAIGIIAVIFHTWGMVYFFSDLLSTFDSQLLFKYGGHAICQVFAITNLMNGLVLRKSTIKYLCQFQKTLLPLTFAKKTTRKRIQLQINVLKIITYSNLIFGVLSAIIISLDKPYNENKVYFLIVTKKMFSSYTGTIFFWSYRICYFVVPLVALPPGFMTCYVGFYSKFQIMIIKDFIKHICDKTDKEDNNVYYDEIYQGAIGEKLKIWFMLYQHIFSEVRKYITINFYTTLLIFLGVFFLAAGIMMDIIKESDSKFSPVACFFVGCTGLLNLGLYAVVGQTIQDESEDLRKKLTELPWYNMNKKNKQLFGIFLLRMENILAFENKLIQIDYSLVVRRILYHDQFRIKTLRLPTINEISHFSQYMVISIKVLSSTNRRPLSEVRKYITINFYTTLLIFLGVFFLAAGIMMDIIKESDSKFSPVACFFVGCTGLLNLGLYAVVGQTIQDENDTNGSTKLLAASAVVSALLTTCLYAFIGQMLKDESENLHRALINLPWYNMNKQNKIMYTIFLIRSEKAISLDIQLIQMDYLLLVRIFRALYSISTLVTRATRFQK
ncbi:hypothetical protein WA026_019766 [Henosepilachna vigintioctopunctata]|uniref:Odorant receptor n=1 Tax=Henosepilachna vigintioctopunctata TaxID=420089 RepID=A0AAW1UIB3_9CUCU